MFGGGDVIVSGAARNMFLPYWVKDNFLSRQQTAHNKQTAVNYSSKTINFVLSAIGRHNV